MPSTGYQSRARVLTPKLKRGDQLPDLAIDVSSELGPVDVSDASRVRVLGQRDGQVVIDRDAQGGSDGVVTMPWELADVVAGVIGFEVEVRWTGASLTLDGAGLYAVPASWGLDANGLFPTPAGVDGSGLFSTTSDDTPRRRTFPSQGLVWVQISPDIGQNSSLVEDPPGSGLYVLTDLFPENPLGSGLFDLGPLVEDPIGSGLYNLDYDGG